MIVDALRYSRVADIYDGPRRCPWCYAIGSLGRATYRALLCRGSELGNDLDGSDDVVVEFGQLLGGDSVFLVGRAPHALHRVALQELCPYAEAKDIAYIT